MNGFLEGRKRVGMTQQGVAQHLGVDRSTVAKWESGDALPRADKLPQIACLYGASIDQLLSKENEKSKTEKGE